MPTIKKLLNNIDLIKTSNNLLENEDVGGIQYDSRQVTSGDLFVAIKGFKTDGHLYIPQAVANKALAVVIDDPAYCSGDYPWILVKDTRKALALLSATFYNNPSEKFLLIGVTGTNGKTTTTNLIAKIFEDQGHKVGLIGTIHNRIGDKIIPVERTTPETLDLQALFSQMVQEKVTCVVMEVSSHALDLHRVLGSYFDIGVFTNLTPEHLDYHQTMEDYYKAKAKLFTEYLQGENKFAIINADDPWGQRLLKDSSSSKLSYGIDEKTDLQGSKLVITNKGVKYQVQDLSLDLKLTGKFNVYNSLAALGVAKCMNIKLTEAIQSLEKVEGISGRFQLVPGNQDFSIIVDYAHTADSLVNILTTAKEFAKKRIITVFGCGGDRDRTKRPLMGEAAATYSDFCFITSDNPRTEDPQDIIADILPGVEKIGKDKYKVIIDRKEAIKEAINLAERDDIIIIAGKGHETYQEIKGKKYPFDDKEIAQEILKELGW